MLTGAMDDADRSDEVLVAQLELDERSRPNLVEAGFLGNHGDGPIGIGHFGLDDTQDVAAERVLVQLEVDSSGGARPADPVTERDTGIQVWGFRSFSVCNSTYRKVRKYRDGSRRAKTKLARRNCPK